VLGVRSSRRTCLRLRAAASPTGIAAMAAWPGSMAAVRAANPAGPGASDAVLHWSPSDSCEADCRGCMSFCSLCALWTRPGGFLMLSTPSRTTGLGLRWSWPARAAHLVPDRSGTRLRAGSGRATRQAPRLESRTKFGGSRLSRDPAEGNPRVAATAAGFPGADGRRGQRGRSSDRTDGAADEHRTGTRCARRESS
jgi:hypothetical protein